MKEQTKSVLGKLPETLTSYKCRANVATDAYRFALDNPLNIWDFKVQRFSKDIPNVVVTFKSELSLEAVKQRMSKIENTQVMNESLILEKEYYGKNILFISCMVFLVLILGGILYVPDSSKIIYFCVLSVMVILFWKIINIYINNNVKSDSGSDWP